MSLQWRRKVVVELFDLDTGTGFDQTTRSGTLHTYVRHKIEVSYNASFGWGADFTNIMLYNLPAEEVGELRKYPNLGIRVYVGFIGETYYVEKDEMTMDWSQVLNLLFVGKVNTIMGVKQLPNHITQLYCIPLAGVFGQKEMTLRTGQGLSVREVISRLCVESGFKDVNSEALIDFTNVPDDVLNEITTGVNYNSSFINCLDAITKEYHLWYSVTNNRVRIYQKFIKTVQTPDPNSLLTILVDRGVYLFVPMLQDVIGVPEATVGTLKITVTLNSKLVVGDVIDISELLVTDGANTPFVNGIVSPAQGQDILYRTDALANSFSISSRYMVTEMAHAIDTHGEAWSTQIMAVVSTEGIADFSKTRYF